MKGFSQDMLVGRLHGLLDRLSSRGTVVASNLANVDTPGYRAMRAEFGDAMRQAELGRLERTHEGHLPVGGSAHAEPRIVQADTGRMRQDGNTVDLDQELTELSAIQGRFASAARMLQRRFALLMYAASDGRR